MPDSLEVEHYHNIQELKAQIDEHNWLKYSQKDCRFILEIVRKLQIIENEAYYITQIPYSPIV